MGVRALLASIAGLVVLVATINAQMPPGWAVVVIVVLFVVAGICTTVTLCFLGKTHMVLTRSDRYPPLRHQAIDTTSSPHT